MRTLPLRAFLCAACTLCAPLLAQQLTDTQRSAIKSACRSDYMKVCSSVPTGTQASLQCLVQHSPDVSAGCRGALAPAMPGSVPGSVPASATPTAAAAAAPATSPAAAAAAIPAAAPAQPGSARDEARLVRANCGGDLQKFCPDVRLGGGRALGCLRTHAAELSPSCQSTLSSLTPAH